MSRYTAFKTVIDGVEKKYRSENATYTWLRAQAANLPDGTRIEVTCQERGAGDRWYPYETLSVRDGALGDG